MATTAAPVLLVVDDESDICSTLAGYIHLALPWVEVKTAPDAARALAVLERGGVGLLLTDFRMPGMDGLQLLLAVQERWPKVKRVLMTAYPDIQLATRALNEAHFARFLVKPVDPAEVKRIVAEYLPKP
ncbi:MAG: response regulator [Thermoplasmatota archaeon]